MIPQVQLSIFVGASDPLATGNDPHQESLLKLQTAMAAAEVSRVKKG